MTRASLAQRYGPGFEERTRQLIVGAGFEYRPSLRVPRSLRALQLGELARAEGCHAEIHRQLFAAYWSDARDIGDLEVLVDVAGSVGLNREKTREALESDAYADEVRRSTATAHQLGVGGVPAWIIDDKLHVPGAQPHEVFDQVMTQLGYSPREDG